MKRQGKLFKFYEATTKTTTVTAGVTTKMAEKEGSLFVRGDNPILNPLVLDLVFNMLNLSTLKNCRPVCQKWLEPATRKMLGKCTININADDVETINEIETWMSTHVSKAPFKNFTCERITHATYPNIWKLLGGHVKSFAVSSWWDDSAKDLTLKDYEDLLLRRCPNLEEISLACTNNFKKAKNFLVCPATSAEAEREEREEPKNSFWKVNHKKTKQQQQTNNEELQQNLQQQNDNTVWLNLRTIKVTGNARPSARFWRIVSLSPKLSRLHVECHLLEDFWNPALPGRTRWTERMRNLQQMEIRSYANEGATESSAKYYVSTPWNLKSACYECYDLLDKELRMMHEHIRHSLESLRMTFFNRKYEPWPANRGGDWMVSAAMTKLKNYRLDIDEHCEGPIFCLALIHSIFLPNLETLILSMYEEGENRSEWGDGLFATIFGEWVMTPDLDEDKRLTEGVKREALRVLVLPPKMQDTSCILPVIRIYPNIRELTMECPSPQVMSGILLHWTSLERLTVTLSRDDDYVLYGGTNWNYIFIGMQIVQDEHGRQFGFLNGASIVNLQRLTSLDITLASTTDHEPPPLLWGHLAVTHLNDLFIYNGLAYLHWLQHIHITGQQFSKEAVRFLRGHLLPFCHVELN